MMEYSSRSKLFRTFLSCSQDRPVEDNKSKPSDHKINTDKWDLFNGGATVLKETNGAKPSVWREIGVLWAKITYFKSAIMLFSK